MKKLIAFLLFVSIGICAIAQKRIGVDFSTRMLNINTTVHYQSVIKYNFLWSVGIFQGGMGKKYFTGDTMNIINGTTGNYSPYPSVNQPYINAEGSHSLLHYSVSAKATGIQAGFGYFFPFGVKHGLRTNVNFRIGYSSAKVYSSYVLTPSSKRIWRMNETYHFFAGVSTELYHTIRLTGRFTFYYGLKVPYHFTVDKARFNPLKNQDLLNGFDPEVSIGLTRVIGKCD
jgi:hypothetical protein